MLPVERDKLLEFFGDQEHWCQNAEGRAAATEMVLAQEAFQMPAGPISRACRPQRSRWVRPDRARPAWRGAPRNEPRNLTS
jgi:hypothetical protein